MRMIAARQIWHDCYVPDYPRDSGLAVASTRGSNDHRIWDHVLKGKAQNVIANMDILLRSWGMYAYTEMPSELDGDRIADHLLFKVNPAKKERNCFANTSRVMMLIALVLQNEVARLNDRPLPYSKTEMARQIGLSDPANYWKGWNAREVEIGAIIDDIDRRALQPLAEIIDD